MLLLLGLPGHLRLLELELPVVHDADHGRARHRRDFYQIESLLHRRRQRGFHIHDPHLAPVRGDHPKWADADLPIDAHSLGIVLDKARLPEKVVVRPDFETRLPGNKIARTHTESAHTDRHPVGQRR